MVDVSQLTFEAIKSNPDWYDFSWEKAKLEGMEFLRKEEKGMVYRRVSDTEYVCTRCEEPVQQMTRRHSIHDGPSQLSGSGKVEHEQVPYCPTCEEEPSSSGRPITVS